MPKFVKLTGYDSQPVWVNTDLVFTLEQEAECNGTRINPHKLHKYCEMLVRETPEQILALIEGRESKITMPEIIARTEKALANGEYTVCETVEDVEKMLEDL